MRALKGVCWARRTQGAAMDAFENARRDKTRGFI
jgi:hypothetical protein